MYNSREINATLKRKQLKLLELKLEHSLTQIGTSERIIPEIQLRITLPVRK
jgi:hypothetical protein